MVRSLGMPVPYLLGSLVAISLANSPEEQLPASALSPPEAVTGEANEVPQSLASEAEELAELLDSCDRALGPGSCVAARAGDDAPWRAVVEFGEHRATVTLSTTTEPVVRELVFSAADGVHQRRASAGLLVAAMTAGAHLAESKDRAREDAGMGQDDGDRTSPAVIAPGGIVEPRPSRRPPNQGDAVSMRWNPLSLELAAAASPFVGAWGLGGQAGFTWWASPAMGVALEARVLRGGGQDFTAIALSGALGASVPVWSTNGGIRLAVHPAVLVDAMRVSDVGAALGERWASRWGGRLGVRVSVGGELRPWMGVGLSALSRPVEIRLNERLIRRAPAIALAVSLGVCWEL